MFMTLSVNGNDWDDWGDFFQIKVKEDTKAFAPTREDGIDAMKRWMERVNAEEEGNAKNLFGILHVAEDFQGTTFTSFFQKWEFMAFAFRSTDNEWEDTFLIALKFEAVF